MPQTLPPRTPGPASRKVPSTRHAIVFFHSEGHVLEEPDKSLETGPRVPIPQPHQDHGPRPPRAIEALADNVVRRLTCAASAAGRRDDLTVCEDLLDAFCAALVRPEPGAALQFIAERRAEGVTREALYVGYICAAARRLGEGWEENRFTFIDVTIGTGHLHNLMRALRAESPSVRFAFDSRRAALFATVPGEDHGIGITVAAHLFRDAGWDIDLRTSTDHDGLMAHVVRTKPAIIGLSLNTGRRLNDLSRLVAAMRRVVPLAIIGVAPGAAMEEDELRTLVDIDLIFRDARSACVELERLVRLRG
jgi:MerR family transcriptional regulator, light-induced transcriptional regulator